MNDSRLPVLPIEDVSEAEILRAELESLSYAISHDLRAPVRAVVGFASALQEDYAGKLDEEGRRLLAIVAGEATRIGAMIDDLLALSRFGSGPIADESIDMAALAREVVGALGSPNGRAASVDDIPYVRGDRAMLRHVWTALLSNAEKATAGRAGSNVGVSATLEPGRVVYCVSDDGIGFDMKYAGKLFGVFQKLHRAADFPGNGANLAMVRRIVHRHGGTVWAESRPGAGASFSFALPRSGPA